MLYRFLRTIVFLAAIGAAILLIPIKTMAESPPQLQSVSSTQPDGAYGVGAVIEIQTAFDKPVTVASGIPSISLNSGGTATYVSGSGTNTLLFNYSPSAGEGTADLDWVDGNALHLNGATVSDSTYGTAANLSIGMPALSASSNIVIDTMAPSGSTFKINGGAYATNAAGVLLTFQYADDFSTAGEVSLSTDGVSWGAWQSTDSAVSETLSGAGSHTYYAKFRDAAGNETAPVTQTIILDVTPPSGTVSIKNGALATPTGIPIPLTLTASDNVSAFSNMQVRFRDLFYGYGAWQPLETNMNYDPNPYGNGMGYIYAQFMDEAGNISSEAVDTIVIDGFDPTGGLTIDSDAAGTASPAVTVAYTANDQYGSYPVTVDIWSSDDSTHQVVPNVALGSSGTLPYTLADADGVKTIYMQVTDASGRTSPVYSKQITLDRVAPSGSISLQSGAALVNTAAVTLSVGRSGTDATSMRFSDDGQTWSDWEAYASAKSYTLPTGDGQKTIYMQLMDVGGNISSTASTSVTLDTVAPSAPVITLSTTEPTTQVTVTIDYPADAATPYEYQIWGENRSTYTGPFTLTSNHTISAYARDTAGNESHTDIGIANIDTTPPTGSLSFQEGAGTSTAAVTLLPDDGGTGATQMQFSDDNSAWTNWEPFGTTKAYTLPSGEGVHTVYMRLQDAVGNISTGTISASITVDTTQPTGTFSIQEGSITASTTVHLLLNDEGSGAVQMQFSDDNVAWSGWEAYANTKSYTLPSGDGLKTIYMQLKDIGGNLSSVVSASVTLDTVAPSAPVITLSTTDPTDQVTVTIDYPADAATPYEYQIWGENRSTYTGPFVLTSNHTISAYARDTAGNESTAEPVGVTNIDTTPPSGTVSFKEGTVTSSTSVTLLLSDGGTGAGQMQLSDDNATWSGWEAYSGSRAYTLPSGDGSKTVYVQLKDAAGNVSTGSISATILLDSTMPAQPILTPSTTDPAQSVSIAIAYAGDAVETTYQINDGAITPYTGSFELSSNATVTAFAKDEAGNVSSATITVNNIDTTAPSGSVSFKEGTVTPSASVTLLLSDGGTGAVQMQFSDDNATWSGWETYSGSRAYLLPPGDGSKTVYVQLKDAVGNVSVAAITATILLDSTPPAQPTLTPSTTQPAQSVSVAIGYAGDVTEATYQINDGAIASYTGPFVLTSNATVTAFAKDGSGNESSAALTVTNIDTQPPSGTMLINGGASVTNTVYVTLTLNDGGTGATRMRFSIDANTWSDWEAYNASKAFALLSGDGGKTVYAQLRDAAGNTSSATIGATIQLVTIVPETANIVSAVTDSTGTMLSVRFDKPMQANVAIEGLILSGTSSVITNTYSALPGSRVFVLQLSQAIQETNDVTLQVTDEAFHGAHGERVPGQAVKVFTPHAIAALKASVDTGGSAFGIDDILGALNRQIDIVGGPGFDQEDVQFWLGLIEPRILSNQTSQ